MRPLAPLHVLFEEAVARARAAEVSQLSGRAGIAVIVVDLLLLLLRVVGLVVFGHGGGRALERCRT